MKLLLWEEEIFLDTLNFLTKEYEEEILFSLAFKDIELTITG